MKPRKSPLDDLYRRPGFLIRRAHQIAVALFLEETGDLRITTTQFGVLHLSKHQPGLDQITVAKLLGLDRSTTGMVLGKLQAAGLVGRVVGVNDRRKRLLTLTPAGEKMLVRLRAPARRVMQRQLACFTPRERTLFLEMLEKFTRAFNESTRVPLEVYRGRENAFSANRDLSPPHPEDRPKAASRRTRRPLLRDARFARSSA